MPSKGGQQVRIQCTRPSRRGVISPMRTVSKRTFQALVCPVRGGLGHSLAAPCAKLDANHAASAAPRETISSPRYRQATGFDRPLIAPLHEAVAEYPPPASLPAVAPGRFPCNAAIVPTRALRIRTVNPKRHRVTVDGNHRGRLLRGDTTGGDNAVHRR